jgi:hypothetical protein
VGVFLPTVLRSRTRAVPSLSMCRSIKTLRGSAEPVTDDDVRAAALQYVRKLSGYRKPSRANEEVFDAAVDEIAVATQRLLDGLVVRRSPTA